ncbi:PSP1 C-terminal domain protein [Peptoniphilus sp. oral taxon 375 str. F0436]|nr:PSP1 C-terminal domain protein [Peptoniphilus sp. oral taxon 375 str. F0436]
MKLIDSAYTYDRSKLLFYFTADGRVDFRNLVRDLARIYRTRIELRQVGVRDEAKFLGGLGACGRRCCCSSFLQKFDPVTIKMAKDQNLSLNSSKISGICGRLMCCLRYEQEGYECMQKKTPFIGELVETDQGRGTVVDRELLLGQVKVLLHDDNASREVFSVEEVKRTYQKDKENHRPFNRVEDIGNEDE